MTNEEKIEALKIEASQHGDVEMAATCDRALAGDSDAEAECLRVIAYAAAEAANG